MTFSMLRAVLQQRASQHFRDVIAVGLDFRGYKDTAHGHHHKKNSLSDNDEKKKKTRKIIII